MTKKKKLLIALLSATCLTAGACGIAACKDKDGGDDTPPTPPEPTYAYSVVAKDDKNKPVKDVWFQIGYYDNINYVFVPVTKTVDNKQVTLVSKTGDDGKAGFDFEPEEGKTYQVKIADPNDLADNVKAYPYGYKTVSNTVNYTNNATTVEYSFKYVPDGFFENERKELNYKRVYDEQTQAPKEVKSENKYDLKKDRHSYFYFQPFEAPKGGDDEKRALFTQAAAGVYEVSFSTASSANVTMYSFAATDAFCNVDNEGKPSASVISNTITSSESKITVELTVYGDRSRAAQYFAIYADADCEVTVNVTRTGNANEPVIIPTTDVTFTAPTSKYPNNSEGKLSLMPLDGTLSVVKGGDGYYHVGSENGPLLLANLTKPLARVGEHSISTLPYYADTKENTFVVGKYNENNTLVEKLSYSKLLSAYAGKVNSDGVYPVNDDLYRFLKEFSTKWLSASLSEYDWLIPCQYYVPEDGFEAKGAGTEADPFILLESMNKLTNTGNSAWVSFTATAAGVYSFNPANGVFTAPSTAVTTVSNGLLYVALNTGDTVKMQLGAASANTSVNVASAAAGVFEASTKEVDDGNGGTTTEPGPGTSANEAITFMSPGLYTYVIDEMLSEDGLYVKIPAIINGTYTLKVYGNGTGLSYNGAAAVSTLTLDVVGGSNYVILLTADTAGAYMLEAAFTAEGAGSTYTVEFEDSYVETTFHFTANEDGWYKFKLSPTSNVFMVSLYEDIFNYKELTLDFNADGDLESASFYAEAGVELEFGLQSMAAGQETFSIVEGEPVEAVELKIGEPVDITVPSGMDGYESPLTVTAGTYTLAIDWTPSIGQETFEIYVTTGMSARPTAYSIDASSPSVEINMPLDEEVTIAIVSSSDRDLEITVTITKKA